LPGTKTGEKGERTEAVLDVGPILSFEMMAVLLLLAALLLLELFLDLLFIFSPLLLFILFLFLLFAGVGAVVGSMGTVLEVVFGSDCGILLSIILSCISLRGVFLDGLLLRYLLSD
jgi:hypothetical protein